MLRESVHFQPGAELRQLEEAFPGFRSNLAGKTVLDFGCGYGYQCTSICTAGAAYVLGIENSRAHLDSARRRVRELGLDDKTEVTDSLPSERKFDIIISQNSFEHLVNAEEILGAMKGALNQGGHIYITFGPPWFAPWGAHMSFFCSLPWVQVFFPEKVVLEARARYRTTGKTYESLGLAKMSIRRFEEIIGRSGLKCSGVRYRCVKNLNWLGRTPIRELFVNQVDCVLTH